MTPNIHLEIMLTLSIARDIKMACKAATVPDVDFRFWKEHF
jgi:hypothetical protein